MMTSSRKPHIFYGHWLIAISFVFMLLSYGCGSFVFSLFVNPLQSAFNWSRGQVMVGFTLFFSVQGLVSPLVGRLVDRFGPRPVITIGSVAMGFGFLLASRSINLPMFYSAYVLIGAGSSGMGIVPWSAIISNWFRRRRGIAIGIMAAGMGTGGLVMAPLVAHLLQNAGWRISYLAMAIIIWAVSIPLSLAFVRANPSDRGLYPDGEPGPIKTQDLSPENVAPSEGLTLRQAAKHAAVWLLGVSFFISGFSNTGALHSPVPFLEDIGFPTSTAAAALGTLGFSSAIGKVFFGWLCDRVPPKRATVLGLGLQLAGVMVLLLIRADSSTVLIWAYALLLGFGIGSWFPTMSVLVSSSFGLTYYGSIFGVIAFLESTGTSLGPLFAGIVFDATGSYYHAFVTFALLYAVAIPTILLIRSPLRPARRG